MTDVQGAEMALCEECKRTPGFTALFSRLSSRSMFALLSSQTSRANKLALLAEHRSLGRFVDWRWQGAPMRSRLEFRFSPRDRFFEAKSYEEDIAPLLKDRMGGPA